MSLTQFPFRTLLIRSSRIFTEKLNAALQEFDLNYSQWIVMHVIHDAEQCSLVDIAKVLNISQPAVTKRIFDLEQKNLIRFISSNNRREKIVALNEQGLDIYMQGHAFLDELEQQYLRGIYGDDFEKFKSMLRLFLDNLEADIPDDKDTRDE